MKSIDTKIKIVFVCTGNICRSPMAEAYIKHRCEIDGLTNFEITSAGIYATHGHPPSVFAQEVLNKKNILWDGQTSSPLTADTVKSADFIIAMSRIHYEQIKLLFVNSSRKTSTLMSHVGLQEDIEDPYGGSLADYEECFNKMQPALDAFLQKIIDKFKES